MIKDVMELLVDAIIVHYYTYGMHHKTLPCMVRFTFDRLRKTEVKLVLNEL